MNKLSTAERCQIIAALVEGNSIASVTRMTGFHKRTILRLLADVGNACQKFHHDKVRGIGARSIQVDELWNFCYAKQKNLPPELHGKLGYGDVWTFIALDSDTKLIVAYLTGRRSSEFARDLMLDLADRVVNRFQLTTDGMNKYPAAVEDAFGTDIDFAQLIKLYAQTRAGEARYSPAACTGYIKIERVGQPDIDEISTSYVERQNLTVRMQNRRFTRLTNAFSKKFENLKHSVALHFMHYNFCRIHQTIRVTPAMEAGLSDHVWEIEELVALLD
jgi:IS1 family transposase